MNDGGVGAARARTAPDIQENQEALSVVNHPAAVAVRADVAAPARGAARGPVSDVGVDGVFWGLGPLRGVGGGEQQEEPWSH